MWPKAMNTVVIKLILDVWDSPKAGCHFSLSAVAEPVQRNTVFQIADFGSEVRILPTVSSSF